MPNRLLAHLAHVELLTPTLDESIDFATSVLGLDVVTAEGDSVYLRCWGDYYAHSLILTAADEPGLGHAAWRGARPRPPGGGGGTGGGARAPAAGGGGPGG